MKPGADPSVVVFAYEGIEGLKITPQGGLEIKLKEGKLFQKRPHIYQEIDRRKVEVKGGFILKPSKNAQQFAYAFKVSDYDRSLPLIIDPELSYSTYLRGSDHDFGHTIAVDSSGNTM